MSEKYDEYLQSHIGAVGKAAQWIADNLSAVGELTREEKDAFIRNVSNHDSSKFDPTEYVPYDDYFYGEPDEGSFDVAWLHHIHANPHHWQHWLLFEDENDGNPKPLEMPKEHVLEMVADWWSFSWRSGNLREVFGWYGEHKDRIILHPSTRRYLESVLGEIDEKLGAVGELRGEGES